MNYDAQQSYPLQIFTFLYAFFTQRLTLRTLRMAEFERIEKVSHLRIFTHNIKIRRFMISCCDTFIGFALLCFQTVTSCPLRGLFSIGWETKQLPCSPFEFTLFNNHIGNKNNNIFSFTKFSKLYSKQISRLEIQITYSIRN